MEIERIGKLARQASKELINIPDFKISQMLERTSELILHNRASVLDANTEDIKKVSSIEKRAFIDRLKLTESRVNDICMTLKEIAKQKSPVDQVIEELNPESGLRIKKITTPIGVIGIIFESRPNVFCDAAALCLRSRNASILRPGTESLGTVRELHRLMSIAIKELDLPKNCVQLIQDSDREQVKQLIKMTKYVDVIVPRGGRSLVELVQTEARVPVFAHLEGIVHIYVHSLASFETAKKVILNSKSRRPGICGAVETVLIDKGFYKKNGENLVDFLINNGVEVRADTAVFKNKFIKHCKKSDFGFEFLDNILAVKIVDGVEEAIIHIQEFGSEHTDCIITEEETARDIFFRKLNSSILMSNASTQFADGGEFGFGAEIGISTGKLHARGPIGARHLVSFQYHVEGNGTLRP